MTFEPIVGNRAVEAAAIALVMDLERKAGAASADPNFLLYGPRLDLRERSDRSGRRIDICPNGSGFEPCSPQAK
jgi:hypothetical protein